MSKHRVHKPETKAKAVLAVLTGSKSAAQVCRELNINESLLTRWKKQFLSQAGTVFQQEKEASEAEAQVAALERLVGRLTLELEAAKKASQLVSLHSLRNGR
jgi:transposase